MAHLSYTIDFSSIDQAGFPIFRLVIDGKKAEYFLIPAALEYGLKHEGILPILNCGCGTVGCGGAYVKVKHMKDKIVWEKVLSGQSCGEDSLREEALLIKLLDKSEIETPIDFDRKQYQQTVIKLLSEPDFEKFEKEQYLRDIKDFNQGNFFYF